MCDAFPYRVEGNIRVALSVKIVWMVKNTLMLETDINKFLKPINPVTLTSLFGGVLYIFPRNTSGSVNIVTFDIPQKSGLTDKAEDKMRILILIFSRSHIAKSKYLRRYFSKFPLGLF